jgi:uncharacterized protein involved in exopolysaccharide biosynthesis
MQEQFSEAENENKRDIFKFDKQILITTLRSKMILILFFSFSAFFLAGVAAKMFIVDKWEVRTVLLRNKKNMAIQTDVPYLYQDLDMDTVIQTIKLRRNLEAVNKKLVLNSRPEKLFKMIRVERGRKSNIIHILTEDTDVDRAVKISNTLAEVFINSFVPIQNSSAGKIYKYYSLQKEELLKKIVEVEQRSEEFNKKRNVISIESETSMKFEQLKELELKKIENSMLITDLKTKMTDYSSEIERLPEEVVLTSTVKNSLEKQLNVMKQKLSDLKGKYTEKNPKVIKLEVEIERLTKKMKSGKKVQRVADEVTYGSNGIREALIVEMNELKAKLKSSEKMVSRFNDQIAAIQKSLQHLSRSQRDYFTIKRQMEMYKELLKTIENRIMEAKIAKESNISDFEILEYAAVPQFPLSSKRKIIALLGGILGFLLSFFIYAFKELFDFTFKSSFDFKEQLGLECVGNLPDKDGVKHELFYAQFHVLLRNILDAVKTNENNPALVVFGSDTDDVGKSFIVAEALDLMENLEKKVLFIENISKPDEERDSHVINDFLSGKAELGEMVPQKLTERFHKMYFRSDADTLKTAFEKEQIGRVTKSLNEYDIIFWELFPFSFNIQLAADIISFSEKFYIVTRFRRSEIEKIEKIIEFLKENNIEPAGILNYVEKKYLQVKF